MIYKRIDKHLNLNEDFPPKIDKTKSAINPNKPFFAESFNLGFYLVTPLLLGVFLGLYLDKVFSKKPFFILTFILIGTIASFYNLIHFVKQSK